MTKIEKAIRKTVKDHYTALSKENNWTFSGERVFDFRVGFDFIAFDVHPGGQGDGVYRWIDSADVLFPKLKKLTGAKYVTVGVCGDLSNIGGIHVCCGGIRRKR